MRVPAQILTLLILLGLVHSACAETFLLTNGGRMEGELLNPEQQPRVSYAVRTSLGRIEIPANQVKLVKTKSEAEAWYERWLPQMGDTLEDNWKMAEACRERGLKIQRRIHLENVLKFDPDHKEARLGLGYAKLDDRWILTDSHMRSLGYVRHGGKWRTRQEQRVEEMDQKRGELVVSWRRKTKLWRNWIVRARGKEAEGLRGFREITDPLASPALIDLLEDEKRFGDLRVLYIETLGRLRTGAGIDALIKLSMVEKDNNVLDTIYTQLEQFGRRQAVARYISKSGLRSSDNTKVNRAAQGLARMKDPDSVPALIEALVTEHKFLISQGRPGGINAGSGGLGIGGKPKLVKKDLPNEKVHDALMLLIGGVDFKYDKLSWKRWYAKKNTPVAVNLRRGQ